jgi:hypothetical protein
MESKRLGLPYYPFDTERRVQRMTLQGSAAAAGSEITAGRPRFGCKGFSAERSTFCCHSRRFPFPVMDVPLLMSCPAVVDSALEMGVYRTTHRSSRRVTDGRIKKSCLGVLLTLRPSPCFFSISAMVTMFKMTLLFITAASAGAVYCEDLPPCGPAGGIIKFAGSSTVGRMAVAFVYSYQYKCNVNIGGVLHRCRPCLWSPLCS